MLVWDLEKMISLYFCEEKVLEKIVIPIQAFSWKYNNVCVVIIHIAAHSTEQ